MSLSEDAAPEHRCFLRVSFQESESIVWEAELRLVPAEASGERILCLDKGSTLDEAFRPKQCFSAVDSALHLYQWISEQIK